MNMKGGGLRGKVFCIKRRTVDSAHGGSPGNGRVYYVLASRLTEQNFLYCDYIIVIGLLLDGFGYLWF